MLMQSHEGYIELLPALPKNWANGSFSGVVARGAFELDYSWADGKVNALKVFSRVGNHYALKSPARIQVADDRFQRVAVSPGEHGTWSFATQAGKTYHVALESLHDLSNL